MTAQNLLDELGTFLATDTPEVICVSGKWGVGKTFAWNKVLGEARKSKVIKLNAYAYVSLFGQNSIDDVKQAIFENTVLKDKAGDEADISSLEQRLDVANTKWRKGIGLLGMLPWVSDYTAGLSKVGFLTVRKQIVCIDDFERSGSGLSARDVLGLVSMLKEQRNCKVVMLLNDEVLLEETAGEYNAQLEKVADTVVRFEPTASEAADIGIDGFTSFHAKLREDVIKLGITNIRVIKKIERFARKLETILAGHDPRILKQAVHSIVLFAFSKFQPDLAPSMTFLRAMNSYESLKLANGKEKDPHAEWRALLGEFGFSHVDELDLPLLEGVQNGYFDADAVLAGAAIVQARLALSDQDNRFTVAWNEYHDSFDDNGVEIIRLIEEAVASCAPAISPMNLSASVTLFKDLGYGDKVHALIDSYIRGRSDDTNFWDLDEYAFRDHVKDPDVQAAFDAQKLKVAVLEDPVEILGRIGRTSGWSPSDIEAAAKITEAQLIAAIKSLRGLELRRVINGALKFRNVSGASKDMQRLTAMATSALQKIGSESEVNRRRVEQYGVILPASKPATARAKVASSGANNRGRGKQSAVKDLEQRKPTRR